jgi:hypothetical protein
MRNREFCFCRQIDVKSAIRSVALSLALSLAACSPAAVSPQGVFFPTLDHESNASMLALIWGRLFERDGCVFIKAGYEGVVDDEVLLIWPQGARAERTSDGTLRVLLDGAAIGEMGERVELGGGFVGESRDAVANAESLIGGKIPDRCRTSGGYWLTSGPA